MLTFIVKLMLIVSMNKFEEQYVGLEMETWITCISLDYYDLEFIQNVTCIWYSFAGV